MKRIYNFNKETGVADMDLVGSHDMDDFIEGSIVVWMDTIRTQLKKVISLLPKKEQRGLLETDRSSLKARRLGYISGSDTLVLDSLAGLVYTLKPFLGKWKHTKKDWEKVKRK